MTIPKGFTRVEPLIPCFDIWPEDTLSDAKRAAYAYEEKQGNILIRSVKKYEKSGMTTVDYLSNCPHEWILQQLAQAPVQMTIGDLL